MKEDEYMHRYFLKKKKDRSEHFRPHTIEGFTGPMFSRKTGRLLERIDPLRFDPRNYSYVAIKPGIDNRKFNSRSVEDFLDWNYLENSKGIYEISKDKNLIAIDEVSFFDEGVLDTILYLRDAGKNIIWAGLDRDFRGVGFKVIPRLMLETDILEKCNAICKSCGNPAYYTQRLINGEPAPYDSPIVSIEGESEYEARCFIHHHVPGKKEL